uniref:Lipoprotein n=1 Tax=Anguilla anguilla TaxID=7936 RepID=A0A0E9RS14_ANGAN
MINALKVLTPLIIFLSCVAKSNENIFK